MLTQNLVKTTKDCEGVDQAKFQSAVRSLLYRTIITRPDITYAVSNVAGFVSTLANDIEFCYQNMHYLKGTLSMGLLFKRDGSNECVGYSDAEWARDTDDCKSTSGYMFQISGPVISWRSMKQICVALSTTMLSTWCWQVQHMKLSGCDSC